MRSSELFRPIVIWAAVVATVLAITFPVACLRADERPALSPDELKKALVVDPDPQAQAKILATIAHQPMADNDIIVPWIEQNADMLEPLLLMELSRRTLRAIARRCARMVRRCSYARDLRCATMRRPFSQRRPRICFGSHSPALHVLLAKSSGRVRNSATACTGAIRLVQRQGLAVVGVRPWNAGKTSRAVGGNPGKPARRNATYGTPSTCPPSDAQRVTQGHGRITSSS